MKETHAVIHDFSTLKQIKKAIVSIKSLVSANEYWFNQLYHSAINKLAHLTQLQTINNTPVFDDCISHIIQALKDRRGKLLPVGANAEMIEKLSAVITYEYFILALIRTLAPFIRVEFELFDSNKAALGTWAIICGELPENAAFIRQTANTNQQNTNIDLAILVQMFISPITRQWFYQIGRYEAFIARLVSDETLCQTLSPENPAHIKNTQIEADITQAVNEKSNNESRVEDSKPKQIKQLNRWLTRALKKKCVNIDDWFYASEAFTNTLFLTEKALMDFIAKSGCEKSALLKQVEASQVVSPTAYHLVQESNAITVYAIAYELKDEFPELTGELVHNQESSH